MLIAEKFADNEIPVGAVNGVNAIFAIDYSPSPTSSLDVFVNGMHMSQGGEDYTLDGTTITFVNAPATGSIIRVFYRY